MKYPPRAMRVEHLNWLMTIFSTDLPAPTKLLASYLNTYMNANNHRAWPSVGRIMQDCSMSKNTVIKHTRILEDEGWLSKKLGGVFNGKNTPNTYTMRWPDGLESCMDEGVQEVNHGGQEVNPGSSGGEPKSEIESEKVLNICESNDSPRTKRKLFKPPQQQEITTHLVNKGYDYAKASDWAEDMWCFYDSKNWMVGKNKMSNWKSAATRWAKNNLERDNGRRKQDTQTRAEFHASTADFIDIHDDNALDRFGG